MIVEGKVVECSEGESVEMAEEIDIDWRIVSEYCHASEEIHNEIEIKDVSESECCEGDEWWKEEI